MAAKPAERAVNEIHRNARQAEQRKKQAAQNAEQHQPAEHRMHQHAVPPVAGGEAFLVTARHGMLEQFADCFVTDGGVAFHWIPVGLGGLSAERHLQSLHTHPFVGLHGHHRHAEAFLQLLGGHGNAAFFSRVGLVDHNNYWQIQLHHLRGEVQMALEVASVYQTND